MKGGAEEDVKGGAADEKSSGSSSSNCTFISVSPSRMRAAARTMLLCLRILKKSCVCFLMRGSINGSFSGASTSSFGFFFFFFFLSVLCWRAARRDEERNTNDKDGIMTVDHVFNQTNTETPGCDHLTDRLVFGSGKKNKTMRTKGP